MDARFRIRTQDGEELNPPTLEVFSELVRSGAVGPQDLVFDELTREWVPASDHPMVRLFRDPLVVDATELNLDLDLVALAPASPEEEARAFVAKMEEERRSDPDVAEIFRELPLVDTGSSTLAIRSEPQPPLPVSPPPVARSPMRAEPAERAERAERAKPTERAERAVRAEGAEPLVFRRDVPRKPRRWWSGIILGGGGLALWAAVLWAPGSDPRGLPGGVAEAASVIAAPVPVTRTEAEVRIVAYEGFLAGVDALRDEMNVEEVPLIWLEGPYLADPGAYPAVREYWTHYEAFVDAALAAEGTLYRGAYLAAAADAGLAGPVRSLRLMAAQEDFGASYHEREAHYARVSHLARTAVELDDLLRALHGRLTYEPIAGRRVSADPVIEAAGTDPEAQVQLEAGLDRVLEALQGSDGTAGTDRGAIPGWLVAGLTRLEGGGVT